MFRSSENATSNLTSADETRDRLQKRNQLTGANLPAAKHYSFVVQFLAFLTLSLALLLSSLVIIGWKLNIPFLIQVHESLVPMQFNTAISLSASALALALIYIQPDSVQLKKCAQLLSCLVIVLAGASLLQYLFNINLKIDELFQQHYITTNTTHPGRMAPQTAICFILTNTAVLSILAHKYKDWYLIFAELNILTVFTVSSFAFIGYFAENEHSYSIPGFTVMAVHTAFGFLLLCAGIMPLLQTHAIKTISKAELLVPFCLLFFGIIIELCTAPGVTPGPAYAPVIIFAVFFQKKVNIIIFTTLTSGLLLFGYYTSSNTPIENKALIANYVLSLIGLWIIGFFAFKVKQTLEALEKQKLFTEAILDHTVEGIITIDKQGIVTSFNKAASTLFGYQPSEVIGQNIKIIMPKPYKDEHDNYLANYLATGQKKIIGHIRHLQGQHKTKGIFDLELSVSEIKLDSGVFFTGIVRDITQRKKQEAEIIRSHKELERFAHVASHDLQEPLRKLTSFAGIIEAKYADKLDETGVRYLHSISKNAQRMQGLIQDILSYSKITSTSAPAKLVDLNASMETILENLSFSIEQSNAKITWDNLPKVYINPLYPIQLLQNILSNAIKYRKPDTIPEIHISVVKQENDWLFSVKDNGIGIQTENLDTIFQPFKRLHNQQKYQGTGIGLATCQKIILQLQGKIWVESTYGEGSTFYWTLPIQAE